MSKPYRPPPLTAHPDSGRNLAQNVRRYCSPSIDMLLVPATERKQSGVFDERLVEVVRSDLLEDPNLRLKNDGL